MTDIESPKKNNDCYFYYYSTCAKGDSCSFRHEPSALGCETMCSFWKEGKCMNIHCNFRHMELRKNRKAIPCYWETQPVGCLKAHCPFMHQKPKPNQTEKSRPDNVLRDHERKVTAVDSLVVNFEEESDNESGIFSPIKTGNRVVTVKTPEEEQLEKVQAESAAYYSYYNNPSQDCLRQRIAHRMKNEGRKVTLEPLNAEIRTGVKRRLNEDQLVDRLGDGSLRKRQKIVVENGDGDLRILLGRQLSGNKVSVTITPHSEKTIRESNEQPANVDDIKIKTLEEIRAEKHKKEKVKQEAEVSSTSADDVSDKPITDKDTIPKKIKLRRDPPASETTVIESSTSTEKTAKTRGKFTLKDDLEDELLENSDDDDIDVNLKTEEYLLYELD